MYISIMTKFGYDSYIIRVSYSGGWEGLERGRYLPKLEFPPLRFKAKCIAATSQQQTFWGPRGHQKQPQRAQS